MNNLMTDEVTATAPEEPEPPPTYWRLTNHGKPTWPAEVPLLLPSWGARLLLDVARLTDAELASILIDAARRDQYGTSLEGRPPGTGLQKIPIGAILERIG
jgi:hypothetical protein